ncbi:MAG TPA: thioesterase family protein [Caulifigura sp.]|jgi:YbgC/YbaW family acyl-CoA thioester hydrolase|nr:thioesterase family protein [Caulifigura sp.]
MPLFTTTRRVQFSETDMAGIVHFANFFRWMEETEHEYFRSLGLSIMQTQPDGQVLGWPRVSTSCNYSAPAHYEEVIDCRLDVERVGVRSVTYLIEFWRDSTKLAGGRMKTACCICHPDGKLTSVDLPDEYRSKIRESVSPASAPKS